MNTKVTNSKMQKSKLVAKLQDKKYRNLFVASQINKLIPYQMRGLRAKRIMTQAELAALAGTTQTAISRIENNGASNLAVKTLLKLAEALDVTLVVRFEPIDKFVKWVDDFAPDDLAFESSEEILSAITSKASSDELMSAGTAVPSLKLVKAQPTGAITKSHTARAHKTLPLFDRPQGIAGTADTITAEAGTFDAATYSVSNAA
ncbi:MAG: helix-turn-helix domain-containing protein [Blastocatellales bacterium]